MINCSKVSTVTQKTDVGGTKLIQSAANTLFLTAEQASIFRSTLHDLLDNVQEHPSDAILLALLSRKPFHITGTQEHRILTKESRRHRYDLTLARPV